MCEIRNRCGGRGWLPVWIGIVAGLYVAAAHAADDKPADRPAATHPTLSGSAGVGGIGFYQPNRWGLVLGHLRNDTPDPQNARLIFRFDDQSQREFIRNVWLPPGTRREVFLPVRFGAAGADQKTAATETLLAPTDAEVEFDRQPGLVRLVQDPNLFAVISDNDKLDDEAIGVMSLARKRMSLTPGMSFIAPHRAMRFDVGWDGVKVAMFSADHPLMDAAQRRGLLRWVLGGGKLLIFADQVDSDAMRELLGEAWSISYLDQVTLTTIRFDEGRGAPMRLSGQNAWSEPTVEVEQPITMTRLTAPGFDTLLEVNRWPALLTRSLGAGQIIVSTLGGRAWTDPKADAAINVLSGLILPTMLLNDKRVEDTALLAGPTGQTFVSDAIGYQIVPRENVAIVLGALIAVLVLSGAMFYKAGRLERVGPVGAVAALAAMGVLVGMGQSQRGKVAPTVSGLQWVHAQPGLTAARLHGTLGFFDGQGATLDVRGGGGGWTWPQPLGQAEPIGRMMWSDVDQWRWPALPIAAGAVRPVEFAANLNFERSPTMHLRFGPDGLSGEVNWPTHGDMSDALLKTDQANLHVDLAGSGATRTLSITPDDVLPRGAAFTNGLLSQTQQRRAAALKDVLTQTRFDEPTLLAWGEGIDWGLHVEPALAEHVEALWSMPLSIEASEPGTKVRIPWPLVEMQDIGVREEKFGLNRLPIYIASTRKWLDEISGPSAYLARFVIPAGARPLKITEAKVHLDITAIGRPVRILTIRGTEPIELARLTGPDGHVVVTLDVSKLQIDARGGVLLAFDVQNADNRLPGQVQGTDIWSVRQFGLELSGVVASDGNTK